MQDCGLDVNVFFRLYITKHTCPTTCYNVAHTEKPAVSPKPKGTGLLINTGMVWKTINIDSPIIIIRIFDGSRVLSNIILKSMSGDVALFSTIMNNESEITVIARDPIISSS